MPLLHLPCSLTMQTDRENYGILLTNTPCALQNTDRNMRRSCRLWSLFKPASISLTHLDDGTPHSTPSLPYRVPHCQLKPHAPWCACCRVIELCCACSCKGCRSLDVPGWELVFWPIPLSYPPPGRATNELKGFLPIAGLVPARVHAMHACFVLAFCPTCVRFSCT